MFYTWLKARNIRPLGFLYYVFSIALSLGFKGEITLVGYNLVYRSVWKALQMFRQGMSKVSVDLVDMVSHASVLLIGVVWFQKQRGMKSSRRSSTLGKQVFWQTISLSHFSLLWWHKQSINPDICPRTLLPSSSPWGKILGWAIPLDEELSFVRLVITLSVWGYTCLHKCRCKHVCVWRPEVNFR